VKTHKAVFESLRFFQDKSQHFLSCIVHELKPISLEEGSLLYQQGDAAEDIYFIHFGMIKLYCNLLEYIGDEDTLAKVRDYDQIVLAVHMRSSGIDEA